MQRVQDVVPDGDGGGGDLEGLEDQACKGKGECVVVVRDIEDDGTGAALEEVGQQPIRASTQTPAPQKSAAKPQVKPLAPSGKRFGPQQLTDRQKRYLEGRTLKGMTKSQARDYAGYPEGVSPYNIEKSKSLGNALRNALTSEGITPEFIAKKLREGMEAERVHFGVYEGVFKDVRRVPDMAVREKYTRDVLEVTGEIKGGGETNITLGVIAVPAQLAEKEWNAAAPGEVIDVDKEVIRNDAQSALDAPPRAPNT